jgi:hypothetical protein
MVVIGDQVPWSKQKLLKKSTRCLLTPPYDEEIILHFVNMLSGLFYKH